VVGVGEMSKLTIKGLYSKGMGKIYLANRTHDNSNLLLEEFPELNIIGFDNRYEVLKDIDVLVSSTSAPHIVFDYEKFKKHYNERNVLLIDLAVPRDIDVAIEGLDNIVAYNIDYFKEISSSNVLFRKQMLVEAEKIIEGYMVGLNQWLKDRSIHGLLSKVDKYVEDNVEEQVEGLLYKLDCNDYMSKEEVKAFALKLSNKLLKKMVLKIKGVEQRDTEEYVGMLHELLE
jgi:glutamyl-tRNA reductase